MTTNMRLTNASLSAYASSSRLTACKYLKCWKNDFFTFLKFSVTQRQHNIYIRAYYRSILLKDLQPNLIIRALTLSTGIAPRRQVTVLQADNWAPLVGLDQQGNDSYLLTARGRTRGVSDIHGERGTLLQAPAEFMVMECILLRGRPLQHSSSCFTLQGSSHQGLANLFLMQALHKLNRQNTAAKLVEGVTEL